MWRRGFQPHEAALGGGLLLLGFIIVALSANLTVGFSYDRVGPRTFPYLIAAMLLISGISVLSAAFSGRHRDEAAEPIQWLPIVIVSATLIFVMLVVKTVGWIPAATVAFAAVAFAFGERRLLLNLLFGFLLACGTFFLFNYGLQLQLPAGSLLQS